MTSSHTMSHCRFCGTALDSSHKNTPHTIKCPHCDREFPTQDEMSQAVIVKLNLAHDKRNAYLFDEAYDDYNEVLKMDPNNQEAYWGLFSCDYGIVYVDDELNHKYIATMNRFLEKKVFDHPHYKKFMSLLKGSLKDYYKKEAEYIEQIRQDILHHMSLQSRFDIFICYKKTVQTEKGLLETQESRYAKNIYHELKNHGYHDVFFAEETLKGSPGAKWEAVIYTALKTAKIMLIMCSSEDYIRSAWVKNEWSRYLKFSQFDTSKTLIPIKIDGFDFNRLPQALRTFQGLDMQDTSFMTSLINKVDTIVSPRLNGINKKPITVVEKRTLNQRPNVEIVRRKIGNKSVKEFKVTPSIEKELDNIHKIYVKRGKFQKASKRYALMMQNYPEVEKIIWAKICADAESIYNPSLLNTNPQLSLESTYKDFELLMNITPSGSEFYVEQYSYHLSSALNKGYFHPKLFLFILSWKEQEAQHAYSLEVFNEFLELYKKDYNDKHNKILFEVLDLVTKTLPKDQTEKYFECYNKITQVSIQQGKFDIAKKLVTHVLNIDKYNTQALVYKGYIEAEAKSYQEYIDSLHRIKIKPWFENLLSSGYSHFDTHVAILLTAIKYCHNKKFKKSYKLVDLVISYSNEDFYPELKEHLIEYTHVLTQYKKFKKVDYYANTILLIDPENTEGYWFKLKSKLKASTNLDVLIKSKKELMEYKEFENALNSKSNNKEILKFYDYDDELNQKNSDIKKFKRALNKHYSVFNAIASSETDLKLFNKEIYPKIKRNYTSIVHNIKPYKKTLNRFNTLLLMSFMSFLFALYLYSEVDLKAYNATLYTVNHFFNFFLSVNTLFFGLVSYFFILISFKKKRFKHFNLALIYTLGYLILFNIITSIMFGVAVFIKLSPFLSQLLITLLLLTLFIGLPLTFIFQYHYRSLLKIENAQDFISIKKEHALKLKIISIITLITAIILITLRWYNV